MVEDPLQVLLRGCKRTRPLPKRSPQTENATSPSKLPAALDFFNSTPTDSKTDQHKSPQNERLESPSQFVPLVSSSLMKALSRMDIKNPTAIQRRAIPLFKEGHSVIGIAPTGSGKTLAYTLPLLQKLQTQSEHRNARVLIIVPTRELAQQIGRVVHRVITEGQLGIALKVVLTKGELDGLKSDNVHVDMVVATPMRVVSMLERGVEMGYIQDIVLDEADELFEEKFLTQVDEIMNGVAGSHEVLVHLFSASLSGRVEEMCKSILRNSRKVVVGGGKWGGGMAVDGLSERVKQEFVFVGGRGEQGKVMAMRALLKGGLKMPVLVFVQDKERAAELFRELVFDGINVDALHGDRSVKAREDAVTRFRSGSAWVLIATDVLARGVDFLGVEVVVNYDVPSSAEMYLHRVGRTGRNGREGRAVTLWTEEDKLALAEVIRVAKAGGADVPGFLGGGRKDEIKRLVKRPVKRRRVGGENLAELGRKRGRKRKSRGLKDDVEAPTREVERNDVNGSKDDAGKRGMTMKDDEKGSAFERRSETTKKAVKARKKRKVKK